MELSIVTPVYNDPRIRRCLDSVISQSGDFEVEHIVVDGHSTDATVDVLEEYNNHIDLLIQESDEGLFDAMNKGISQASGDIVGILNADDRYQDTMVLQDIVNQMTKTGADVCYGDIVYVDDQDNVVRYWQSGEYESYKFYYGWMPPHPTLFVRRELYEKYGKFDLSFSVAADYDFILRLLFDNSPSVTYLNRVLVRMALGGNSNKSFSNMLKAVQDMYLSWKKYNLRGRFIGPFMHPLEKVPQHFRNPPKHLESIES